MDIKQYLDATFLKTAAQSELEESAHTEIVLNFIIDTINEKHKCVMIRPEFVSIAKAQVLKHKSHVLVGTVISFPEGDNTTEQKLQEAQTAIDNGADELDFVIDYISFKNGKIDYIKEQVFNCTKLAIDNFKTAKWIIETAALTPAEIVKLSTLIKNVIMKNFDEKFYDKIFVKSSTGFYKTETGIPNGATKDAIIIMLENASPLPVKASGGVRNTEEAIEMIRLGVKRIGTSSANAIANGWESQSDY